MVSLSPSCKYVFILVIYQAFGLDVAQGRMNGAPIRHKLAREGFASLACLPLHNLRLPVCFYFTSLERFIYLLIDLF